MIAQNRAAVGRLPSPVFSQTVKLRATFAVAGCGFDDLDVVARRSRHPSQAAGAMGIGLHEDVVVQIGRKVLLEMREALTQIRSAIDEQAPAAGAVQDARLRRSTVGPHRSGEGGA